MNLDQVHLGISLLPVNKMCCVGASERRCIWKENNLCLPLLLKYNHASDKTHLWTTQEKNRVTGRWFVSFRYGIMADTEEGVQQLVCISHVHRYHSSCCKTVCTERLWVRCFWFVSSFLKCTPALCCSVSRFEHLQSQKSIFIAWNLSHFCMFCLVWVGIWAKPAVYLLSVWTSSLTGTWKHEGFICSFELHPFSGHEENKTRHKWLMQNLGRKYCRVPCCLITSLGISQHFHNSKPIYTCFPTVMWRHNLI